MHPSLLPATNRSKALPIICLQPADLQRLPARMDQTTRTWIAASGFAARAGEISRVPGADGAPAGVLFGLGAGAPDPFLFGELSARLGAGTYAFERAPSAPELAALGWVLGTYVFTRYGKKPRPRARLKLPRGVDGRDVSRTAEAVFLARDLINTPANHMGPAELEAAIRAVGKRFKARITTIRGDDLLKRNFPLIHAVGRASAQAPRLVDLKWGQARHPKVTLVGKGVSFDTGGLNLKSASNMALMKKDMGGAANALALAQMIMDARLPVCLRLLIPAVENAVAGNAFRPGDVYASRAGLTVEIGNTDAEGRLILADALALADAEKPDLLIDLATLTGAARVALGPDLPPFYTADDALARQLHKWSEKARDPLWRMPLWADYEPYLDSGIADVNHISRNSFAGSITAALFLGRFVEQAKSWVHLDIFGWVPDARPARPKGGEAQGIRALFALIADRYR